MDNISRQDLEQLAQCGPTVTANFGEKPFVYGPLDAPTHQIDADNVVLGIVLVIAGLLGIALGLAILFAILAPHLPP